MAAGGSWGAAGLGSVRHGWIPVSGAEASPPTQIHRMGIPWAIRITQSFPTDSRRVGLDTGWESPAPGAICSTGAVQTEEENDGN